MTPFFGREEVGLLHALAALADLSLARCVLAESEQAGRVALQHAMEEAERANTAKSDFVSRMSSCGRRSTSCSASVRSWR
jgi:DICT domain-containing protein